MSWESPKCCSSFSNIADAEKSAETWRAREAQLLADKEALTAQVQQVTADLHELKAECLAKERQHKEETTELELKASQAASAELNTRHQLCLTREKLSVMEDDIRQLSDTNARLAGRCNSVQVEASRASQKLHINQQELSTKLRLFEERITAAHDQFSIQIDAHVTDATEFEESFSKSIESMEFQMGALQVCCPALHTELYNVPVLTRRCTQDAITEQMEWDKKNLADARIRSATASGDIAAVHQPVQRHHQSVQTDEIAQQNVSTDQSLQCAPLKLLRHAFSSCIRTLLGSIYCGDEHRPNPRLQGVPKQLEP